MCDRSNGVMIIEGGGKSGNKNTMHNVSTKNKNKNKNKPTHHSLLYHSAVFTRTEA